MLDLNFGNQDVYCLKLALWNGHYKACASTGQLGMVLLYHKDMQTEG